jgi:hypothetical protein
MKRFERVAPVFKVPHVAKKFESICGSEFKVPHVAKKFESAGPVFKLPYTPKKFVKEGQQVLPINICVRTCLPRDEPYNGLVMPLPPIQKPIIEQVPIKPVVIEKVVVPVKIIKEVPSIVEASPSIVLKRLCAPAKAEAYAVAAPKAEAEAPPKAARIIDAREQKILDFIKNNFT